MGTLAAFILAVVIYSSLAILKSCLVVSKKPDNSKLISVSTEEESSDNENSFTIENSLESNSKNLKSILLENRNNPEIKSLVETQLKQINSIVDSRKQEQEFEKLKEVKNKLNANKRYLDSVEQTNWD